MGRGRMRRGRDCGERGVRQKGAAALPVRANTGGTGSGGGQARRRRRLHHTRPSRPERGRLEAGRCAPRRGVRVHRHHPTAAGAGAGAGNAGCDGAGRPGPGRRRAGGTAAAGCGREGRRRSRRHHHGARGARPRRLRAPGVAGTAAPPQPAAGDIAGAAGDTRRAAPVLHRGGLQRSRPPRPAEHAGGTATHCSTRRAGRRRDRVYARPGDGVVGTGRRAVRFPARERAAARDALRGRRRAVGRSGAAAGADALPRLP